MKIDKMGCIHSKYATNADIQHLEHRYNNVFTTQVKLMTDIRELTHSTRKMSDILTSITDRVIRQQEKIAQLEQSIQNNDPS